MALDQPAHHVGLARGPKRRADFLGLLHLDQAIDDVAALHQEAVHALIDHAFGDLDHEALQASARVTNPASRRVLEKCGFQWTGVGLCRVRAIHSSAPVDRFRLERGIWASLKSWGKMRRVG